MSKIRQKTTEWSNNSRAGPRRRLTTPDRPRKEIHMSVKIGSARIDNTGSGGEAGGGAGGGGGGTW